MNANAKPRSLLLLLGLICIAATTQQSASSPDANASPQAIPNNKDTSKTPLKSDDRVPPCPAEFSLPSLPQGIYRAGGDVVAPTQTKTSEATLSDEARAFIRNYEIKQFEATSIVGLTVDTNGEPQDICVLAKAGHGLDQKALEAIAKYRFKPGTLHGKPVPVRFSIAIIFSAP